jgi:hypothetical protein
MASVPLRLVLSWLAPPYSLERPFWWMEDPEPAQTAGLIAAGCPDSDGPVTALTLAVEFVFFLDTLAVEFVLCLDARSQSSFFAA